MDLYSVLEPVIPCLSTKISRLEVKMKVSLMSLKPNSISSPSMRSLPKSLTKSSLFTVPALPKMAEKSPILNVLNYFDDKNSVVAFKATTEFH